MEYEQKVLKEAKNCQRPGEIEALNWIGKPIEAMQAVRLSQSRKFYFLLF